MAPNITGIKVVDQSAAIHLNELALDFSCNWLKPNGHFLVKSFIGADFDSFVKSIKPFFKKVIRIKPSSSRDRSSEIFVLGYEKIKT
jgi:23S rRNA (uridine2552-2'-O)-methyltransferase